MSSIEQLRFALEQVREHLDEASACAGSARRLLAQAQTVLDDVDRDHHESLTPPEMRHADSEIDRALVLIAGAGAAIEEFAARL